MSAVALHTSILCLLPALALALPLLMKRYPGERVLLSLTSPRRSPRKHPTVGARPRWRIASQSPRGGLLLGRSLAERPPPAFACPA